MQNWEYLFVECVYENGAYRPKRVNQQELRDWKKGAPISDFANRMGAEGWELVAAIPYPGFPYQDYIFKRPKP